MKNTYTSNLKFTIQTIKGRNQDLSGLKLGHTQMAATQEQGTSAHNKSTEATDRSWYVSRKKIEEDSPSRRDGIALGVENAFRLSFTNFLQQLGTKLNLPELTIATATLYCHRFFLRRSHKKNKKWTISMACMFLASEVEKTPRSMKDLVTNSCRIILDFKYGPAPHLTIAEKVIDEGVKHVSEEVRLVAATLDNDLCVQHPYQCLLAAAKKFQGPSKDGICQYARDVANETWLKTSLCLQYKPEHIAAAAIFLAAKLFKESVQYDSKVVLWQEFDVPLPRVEDIGNHMLEEYENIQKPLSHVVLAFLRAGAANLYKRWSREKREEFMQYLNLPDEPD